MLLAAGFFGYMLALLQRRVGMIVFPQNVSHLFFNKLSFLESLLLGTSTRILCGGQLNKLFSME